MGQVLRAFWRYGATVTMVAMVMASTAESKAATPLSVDLPPCAVGRIVNHDTLSLSDCTISGNSTGDPGGGIENYGTMYLTNVVISGNRGASGGGIYNGGGSLTLTNVTISDNVADGLGGGIFNDGGAVFMSDVTIARNRSGAGGGGLANLYGASTIGANVALIENETTAGDGGGILNDSSVCLSAGDFNTCFDTPAGGNSLVRDNRAAGNGGGIANLNSIVLSDSTVDRNQAEGGDGGGVWNGGGTTQLVNVTISNNTTTGDGGGLFNGGFGAVCCASRDTDYAFNLTIAANHADGNGGGVYTSESGYTGLASATIADNSASGSGSGVHNDDASYAFTELKDTLLARNGENCAGTIFSSGHNVDTGLTCNLSGPADRIDVRDDQIGLDALAANGGPAEGSSLVFDQMMTIALDLASPAVDAGSDSCPATDQRGVTRPQIAACDIGAFELQPRATATVTATITASNKTYDATTEAAINTCTLTGAFPQDEVSCVASDGAFDTANVGAGKQVTATVALTGAAAGKYQLSSNSAMATADITPAPAFVTPDSKSKPYGTADPALTGTVSGFYGTDSIVTATYHRTPGENVTGNPYMISATLSPAGVLANYTITYNTASFVIVKANASVTPNAATKMYGTPDPPLTGVLSGFLATDGVTAVYGRTPGETVAGNPYLIAAALSPAAVLANYNVTYNTANFVITAGAALSLTKTANPTTYAYAGQTIVYTYVVRNTGGATVTGPFMISDDKLGSFECGTSTSLAPAASVNCTKSYIIQASDLGSVPSLPTGAVANVNTGAWLQGVMSTQDTTITSAAGLPNGIYPGWCIQDHVPNDLHNQPGTLYSTIGGGLPADVTGLPWNKINYLLNHKIRGAGRSDLQFLQDVQTAIWLLLGEQNPDFGKSAPALQMVANANANPAFVPGEGDTVAVIVYSDGMGTSRNSIQESIVEMKPFQQITNHAIATGKAGSATVQSSMAQATVSQTANAAPVDVAAHGDQGTVKNSVTTTAFSTTSGNRLLLAFVAADNTGGTNTTVTSVTGAGLTWQLVVRANAQRGTAEIWRAFAPSALTNVTVTAKLSQPVESMLTVLALTGVDTSGANGSGAIGRVATNSAASGAPTVTLTTTRANSWVFAVGNDWDNPIPRIVGPNQALVQQYLPPVGDTYWVQRLINQTGPSGSIVTLNDSAPTSDRWNLATVEVLVPFQ